MRWRSHALIGAVFSGAFFYLQGTRDPFSLGLLALFGALCALAPDLDHEQSKGKKILDGAFVIFALLSVYLGECGGVVCLPAISSLERMILMFLAIVGVYAMIFMFFKPRHRGITHTIVAGLVFGVLIYLVAGLTLAIAGLVGYLSHLVADMHVKLI